MNLNNINLLRFKLLVICCLLMSKFSISQQTSDSFKINILEYIFKYDTLTYKIYGSMYGNEIIVIKESIFSNYSNYSWKGLQVKYLTWDELKNYLTANRKEKKLIIYSKEIELYNNYVSINLVIGLINNSLLSTKGKFVENIASGVINLKYDEIK
jgi:hypothetical protein